MTPFARQQRCDRWDEIDVGAKECLLVLGNLRESTSGVADSSTAPILFGHSGDYASAGNRSVSKWWRTAHPSSNDGGDGSGQRVGTKRWRALCRGQSH